LDTYQIANCAAIALQYCGELQEALGSYITLLDYEIKHNNYYNSNSIISNISECLNIANLLAKSIRVDTLSFNLASVRNDREYLFLCRLDLFSDQSQIGQWAEAESTWQILDPMGRDWPRGGYRPGDAEYRFARFQFWQGTLQEAQLATAEQLAAEGKNRTTIRDLHRLRGAWWLEQRKCERAAASFSEALRLARESGVPDAHSETGLALARHHLGQVVEPQEAERLGQQRQPSHRYLAMIWQAIGDLEQAKCHALAAYTWAWADGEPYVNRYELTKTTELLHQLHVPIPNLPPYDPAKDEPFPWEADVRVAIDKLRAQKQAKSKGEG
jgi:hypothetical protein